MLSKTKIKYIQSLGQKKFRDESWLFIAEGPRIVEELLASKETVVEEVFGVKDWIQNNQGDFTATAINEITDQELKKISQLITPNKVLAVVRQFENEIAGQQADKIVLALDHIQDPGNFGSIIRIADWFGIKQIFCSYDCTDVYNPKVVQSTMGSIARVRVFYSDLEKWLLNQSARTIYATSLVGDDITTMNKIEEGIIIVGNEASGIDPSILKLANHKITIPKKGGAESLNAAVATGIVLSHIT